MKKILKKIPKGRRLYYTWDRFDKDCQGLASRFRETKLKPASIVCIAVGGLCLGARLRNLLKKGSE